MNRKWLASLLVLVALTSLTACGTMNKATPAQWDDEAIEADVRSKIATAVTEKTFAVEVDVKGTVVTLSGHADSDAQRKAIAKAASEVNGVSRVINNIHVQ